MIFNNQIIKLKKIKNQFNKNLKNWKNQMIRQNLKKLKMKLKMNNLIDF